MKCIKVFFLLLLLTVAACSEDDTASPGSLDTGFRMDRGIDSAVNRILVQPDGKILIGGAFTGIDGQVYNRIARLNADGSLDPEFDPGYGANDSIFAMALQKNGKILIGGSFTTFDGIPRQCLARLNPDGSLDLTFNSASGTDNGILCILANPDGTIMIGGWFTSYAGTTRPCLAKLYGDGSLVTGFDPGAAPNNQVLNIKPNGNNYIITGLFTSGWGITCNYIASMDANGTVTALPGTTGANSGIYTVAACTNGDFLLGGSFTEYNGSMYRRIVRITSNGAPCTNFHSLNSANGRILTIAVQPDDKILIGGYFTQYAGVSRNGIARLNPDGTLDTGFDPGTGISGTGVNSIMLQTDGGILAGGDYTNFNNAAASQLVRLHP